MEKRGVLLVNPNWGNWRGFRGYVKDGVGNVTARWRPGKKIYVKKYFRYFLRFLFRWIIKAFCSTHSRALYISIFILYCPSFSHFPHLKIFIIYSLYNATYKMIFSISKLGINILCISSDSDRKQVFLLFA